MNEMDELSRFRAEVPDRGTARAAEIFRAALANELSSERRSAPRFRNRFRELRPAWRAAVAVPLALGLAAGVTVAALPSRPPVLTAELLADRAATAALASPAVPAGQWIYQRSEHTAPGGHRAGIPNPFTQDGWMTADGRITEGAGVIGDVIIPYDKLGSLPTDPAALDRYLRSLDPVASDDTSSVEFGTIMELMLSMVLPPALQAEMYHALALIPDVQVRQNVTDIAGRAGVAFLLPPTKQSEQLEIILDAADYHLLAQASWDDPSKPSSLSEDAILKEYPVAEQGSTQPSTVPPSAAELAAERIVYSQEYVTSPSQIVRPVTPGQWLYRDLRTGGKDQEIWATADDSAQAAYANGTLRVCKRTDPCAASEQWLVPAGPSYSLIFPPYPRLPRSSGKPVKPLPALPQFPRQLLDQLNTYNTGCTDVAGDCNAVNVTANVLTGYGNQSDHAENWFLALADVPGVSVRNITDAAGHQDIEFVFPFQDGVTGILVNASTYHFAGYVTGGTQTLLVKQATVSGPGVLPGK
jgi:hypothetical protein